MAKTVRADSRYQSKFVPKPRTQMTAREARELMRIENLVPEYLVPRRVDEFADEAS